jgi:3-hydroxyisobutyrate dehydrogenase
MPLLAPIVATIFASATCLVQGAPTTDARADAFGDAIARNLAKAGHGVAVFEILPELVARCAEAGATPAASAAEAARGADLVITMLPAGAQVREAWLGAGGMAAASRADAILIDCSTIDVATAREVAADCGRAFLDAPVSGGVWGRRRRR